MSRLIAMLPLLALGCVGKSKYEALRTDYDNLVEENRALVADLQSCADELKAAAACQEPMDDDEEDEEAQPSKTPPAPPGSRLRPNR